MRRRPFRKVSRIAAGLVLSTIAKVIEHARNVNMPHATSWSGFLLAEESPSSFFSILRLVVEPRLFPRGQKAGNGMD